MCGVIDALRVTRRERRGSSSPVFVSTEAGERFVKLRGASQGVLPLVAEIIVAELAERIGLLVPARELVMLPAHVESDDRNDELRDLLDASAGLNLGFVLLTGARDLLPTEFTTVDLVTAARVLWLDALVQNFDRTAHNANLMVQRGAVWCIDHGACLPWQHDWRAVSESTPLRPYQVSTHIFQWAAPVLADVHEQAAPRITRETLRAAAALVPNQWLGDEPDRRREAYVAVLWKRLNQLPHILFPV
jgi:hypothetical protein